MYSTLPIRFLVLARCCGTFWTKSELFLKKILNRKRNASRAFSCSMRGANDNTTAPSPSCLGRPPDQNHFLFNLLFGSSPDPSTEKERKVRKWFCRSGSLQSFQNNKLKQVLLLTQYRLLFLHSFANCDARLVVNR